MKRKQRVQNVRATCHPDKPHIAKGLCSTCYARARYADPIIRASIRKYANDYHADIRSDPTAYAIKLERNREYRARSRERKAREALPALDLPRVRVA